MPASEIGFIVIVVALVSGLVVALRAPTRPLADARNRARRMSATAVGAILASVAMGSIGQPGLGLGAAAVGAGAAAIGVWLSRCAGGEDDGPGPPDPEPPDPNDEGRNPEWDLFDRERSGWDRPKVGAG
jgi:hypothetical protein